ncbi:hypothetical protein E6C50_01690 [Flavobacterium supellecticarium]|uniref:Uncharacterized protein n=1 Tax=Flavobacterium supellecticarium TaxID=2565924 RepID=A0A4S4A4S0_9FLAO|nr:hypothetical protein [Flavobacterium supellecticarium]THF52945.1 hypothetical protein E6C50_01690 [Flavobacterium supellecticarium]
MTITTAIILGLFISFVLIIYIVKGNPFQFKKKNDHQDLIDSIQERIAKANGATIEHYALDNLSQVKKPEVDFYKDAEFVNKECTNLDDFIINDQLNSYDLRKLADLNGIQLQIRQGWHPLLIEMLQELDQQGWNRSVSCIKEKYASLRFYTQCQYEDPIQTILEEYEYKSEKVCETCGKKGEIRYNSGWDYVACQEHYVENRGEVTIQKNGFIHNDKFYEWNNIKKALFDKDLDYSDKHRFLKIELKKPYIEPSGWPTGTIYIANYVTGFGSFLNHIPKGFPGLDYNYIKNFENPEFCEICGYKAVYFDRCECCESLSWSAYHKQWKTQDGKDENEEKRWYLKHKQMNWQVIEGDKYVPAYGNYTKKPDHKILYTELEFQDYLNKEDLYPED